MVPMTMRLFLMSALEALDLTRRILRLGLLLKRPRFNESTWVEAGVLRRPVLLLLRSKRHLVSIPIHLPRGLSDIPITLPNPTITSKHMSNTLYEVELLRYKLRN